MALANFFDKAALAASHILNGYDTESFSKTLQANAIGVFFGEDTASTQEGRTILEMAVNLLARLYPSLVISPVSGGRWSESLQERLGFIARAINPDINITSDPSGITAAVTVGTVRTPTDVPTVYAGADGWLASISSHRPLTCGSSDNPFGAGVAACFAVANIFRYVFASQLLRGGMDGEWTLSLLDFSVSDIGSVSSASNPPWHNVDIGETHLVGIGAVGSGTVWSLARASGLEGTLHLIDGERYELTNLQRYVLASQEDIGKLKSDKAFQTFTTGGSLSVFGHAQRWEEYMAARGNWKLDHVAVALDSGKDRCTVQAALPRRIVNAWTQTGDLGVSRHGFVNDEACLMCLYLPDKKQKGTHEMIADSLGMPEAANDFAQLLYGNKPLGKEWISKIAAANNIVADDLAAFETQTLSDFHSKAVCGGVILALGGSVKMTGRTEVPMAFQSALAGVLLGAEIVIGAGGLRSSPVFTTTRIDLLRPLASYLSFPEKKHRSGACVCQDNDYVEVYNRKYAESASR